jgi:tetratricopeptide (TPR) repeat protein
MGTASAISDEDRRDYNEAVDLIDRIEGGLVTDHKTELEAWQRALGLALSCANRNGQNADFNYLAGYIYARAPQKTEETLNQAESLLRRALELNSNHHLARYCLGTTFFNQKKYSQALQELNELPDDASVFEGQWWRVVKAFELRLCCEFYLESGGLQMEKTERLYELYMSFKEPRMAPVPTELADCIVFLLRQRPGTPAVFRLCQTCARLFEHLQLDGLLHQRWPEIEVA